MGAIMVASATGAPGVTTTALALALLWPADTVLIDADGHPSQSILAGYLRGSDGAGRGVTALAGSQRGRSVEPVDLLSHCVTLSSETQQQRMFLPGMPRPGGQQVMAGAFDLIIEPLRSVSSAGIQLVIDSGRLTAESPPACLIDLTSQLLIVTRTNLRALAALRLHLPVITRRAGLARIGLILVGEAKPYTGGEISNQFGVPVVGAVRDDPSAAAVLSDGEPAPRGFVRGAYARSLRGVVDRLVDEARILEPKVRP